MDNTTIAVPGLRHGEYLKVEVKKPNRGGGLFVKLLVGPIRSLLGELRGEAWHALVVLGALAHRISVADYEPGCRWTSSDTRVAIRNDQPEERVGRNLLSDLEHYNVVRRLDLKNRGRGGGKVTRLAVNPDYVCNGSEDQRRAALEFWIQLTAPDKRATLCEDCGAVVALDGHSRCCPACGSVATAL